MISSQSTSEDPRVVPFLHNGWGLYDILGNVGECTRWLGIYPDEPVVNPFAPPVAGEDALFSHRGFEECRSAHRGWAGKPDCNWYGVGFRPVRTLPESTLPEPALAVPDTCPEMATYPCQGQFAEVSNLIFSAASS